jgi:hypothetical protein
VSASATEYVDKELTCVECKNSFTFTARDQAFYAQQSTDGKPWTPPKRCKPCRDAKKSRYGGA